MSYSSSSSSAPFTSESYSGGSTGFDEEALITGISGFYEIDHMLHASEQKSDWHSVEITWNHDKGTFTWQNSAGVTWTLTPMMGSSGSWDDTKLAVGNDCPYRNDGHEFAMLEWVSFALLSISSETVQ